MGWAVCLPRQGQAKACKRSSPEGLPGGLVGVTHAVGRVGGAVASTFVTSTAVQSGCNLSRNSAFSKGFSAIDVRGVLFCVITTYYRILRIFFSTFGGSISSGVDHTMITNMP